MNKLPKRCVLALISALTAVSGSAYAQSVASPAADAEPQESGTSAAPTADVDDGEDEEMIILDPFTVTADIEGYVAEDTLGGTRTRTKLIDTPSATTVITPKFMQDLAVRNSEDLLRYTTSTESGGFYGTYSGLTSRGAGAGGEGDRLIHSGNINRSRGISNLDNTRNYMLSSIPWDGFNVSRVDMTRGPNSFLFGAGSPSGVLNYATNEASYKNGGSIEGTYGSFGSRRATLDVNQEILADELAVRLNLLDNRRYYQQKPAYSHDKRAYVTARYEPKFLDLPSAHTKITANYEFGKVRSNNARITPPTDNFTGYIRDPRSRPTGYNHWLYNSTTDSDLNESWWVSNGSIGNWYMWDHAPHYKFDAATGQVVDAGHFAFDLPDNVAVYGMQPNRTHVHSVGYSGYAYNANRAYRNANGEVDGGEFAGAELGYVRYYDESLKDRRYFDYFNKLIDGVNKSEFQDFDAVSLNVTQSLLDNKLNIQAVYAFESYERGSQGMLNGSGTSIMLELDEYLFDVPSWMGGTRNPNVNRPLVFGQFPEENSDLTERENYQLNISYSLDTADFIGNETLASILGKHNFTLLGSRSIATDYHLRWKKYGMNPADANTWYGAARPSENRLTWHAYLAPAYTSGVTQFSDLRVDLSPASLPMRVYSDEWRDDSVDPDAVWNIPQPDGSTVAGTQSQNPANYVGYGYAYTPVINSDTNKRELITDSSLADVRIDSKSFLYQGFFWDDTIIPSFGYREDRTRQRGTQAQQDFRTGYVPEIRELAPEHRTGITATTRSKSYGVAVHMPKAVKRLLPDDMGVSLYYFHGANETPRIRYAVDGTVLPNEIGETDDYSIAVNWRNTRVKFTKFKTASENTPASYGSPLGGSGWYIGAAPSWGLTMAAAGLIGWQHPDVAPTVLDTWFYEWGQREDMAELMPQIAEAFSGIFTEVFPQEYWDRFNSNVDVAAIQRGDWLNVLTDTHSPYPWTIRGSGIVVNGTTAIIDQDVVSKGYELEIGAQLFKNWDVSFSASQIEAIQQGLGEEADRFFNDMNRVWNLSAFGRVAEWGGGGNPLVNNVTRSFNMNVWAPYNVQAALVGSPQPELAKYRFTGVSNYRFDQGFLRGVNIGGSARWEDKPHLGFGIHEVQISDTSSIWISDVDQALYGDAEMHFDLWLGYGRKLSDNLDWRVQLNIRSVGEKTGTVPITMQPNGQVAQTRIKQGQTFDLSMKFSF